MTMLSNVILFILKYRPQATDRQLSEAIFGSDNRHQDVNQGCRLLEARGLIQRTVVDGLIRNSLQREKPVIRLVALHRDYDSLICG